MMKIEIAAAAALIATTASAAPVAASGDGHLTFTSAHSNMVMISVGGGKPVPATFDTGSIGLQIYDFAVGKDVTQAKDSPGTRAYGGGRVFHVKYAMAKVAIEGISTVKPIEIAIVTEKSCTDGKCPDLTGAALEAAAKKSGRIGIMGVGFGSEAHTPNPIRELPAQYSDGYVVSNEGITLGLASASGFKTVSQPAGTVAGTYGKLFNACLTIAKTTLKKGCSPTLFDTGNGSVTVAPSQLAQLPTTPHTAEAVVPGAVDWKFTAGGPHQIRFHSHAPAVLGLPFLTGYDVEIDLAGGKYGFQKRAQAVPFSAMRNQETDGS
jgi:hypothetical protein